MDSVSLLNKLPKLGHSKNMDFQAPNGLDLDNTDSLNKFFQDLLKSLGLEVLQTHNHNYTSPDNFRMGFFILSTGNLTYRAFPDKQMLSVDYFSASSDSSTDIDKLQTALTSRVHVATLTGNLWHERGLNYYYLQNEYEYETVLFKGFKLIHQEQTKYQDLKIFDTGDIFGRILSLDNMIQNGTKIMGDEDFYTIDLTNLVLEKGKTYERILIIGAGDMIIPKYILDNFDVKKLIMAEIDDRVIENTKKYFDYYKSIEPFIQDGRFEVNVTDGSKFVKDSEDNSYDGIIIDNSDVYLFEGPAANLFNEEFYTNLRRVLKSGSRFSQQVSEEKIKLRWIDIVSKCNFDKERFTFKNCTTKEYSQLLPLASAQK